MVVVLKVVKVLAARPYIPVNVPNTVVVEEAEVVSITGLTPLVQEVPVYLARVEVLEVEVLTTLPLVVLVVPGVCMPLVAAAVLEVVAAVQEPQAETILLGAVTAEVAVEDMLVTKVV